jgi:phage head maturation protease
LFRLGLPLDVRPERSAKLRDVATLSVFPNKNAHCHDVGTISRFSNIPVLIDHDWRQRVADSCELFVTGAGLCTRFEVAPASELAVLRYARKAVSEGRRLSCSVKMALEGLDDRWSTPPRRLRTIVQVREILEISLTMSPAYADTWIALDSEDARRRIDREDLEARQRQLEEARHIAC